MFLIFVGATTLFHIVWRRAPRAFDQALMVINAAAYFGISYGLLWEHFRPWMGGFSILLALFYGGVAYAALRRSAENVRLSFFALGVALVLLTVAIPVQLGDRAWTTIAWAAEGAVVMWLSFNLRMPQLRIFSYGVFAIVAVRLLFFDTPVDLGLIPPCAQRAVPGVRRQHRGHVPLRLPYLARTEGPAGVGEGRMAGLSCFRVGRQLLFPLGPQRPRSSTTSTARGDWRTPRTSPSRLFGPFMLPSVWSSA